MNYLLRVAILAAVVMLALADCFAFDGLSPVTNGHLIMIESLFRDNGLSGASAKLDKNGRVLLSGNYKGSREVGLAFSLAQSVVGVRWTSPVAPENVKVREWAQNLSMLFPTRNATEKKHPAADRGSDGTGNRFALVVGVGRFRNDLKGKNALKYATNDAREVSDYLTGYGAYRKGNITVLLNEMATRANIQRSMDAILERARSNDEVFIYFSSHGAPVYDGSLNIVTYDTEFRNHFTMGNSSFPSKSIRSFIERTSADKVYVVLDVCYSGAVFKGIEGFYASGSKSISFDDDNQGLSREAMAKTLMGAKDISFEDDAAGTQKGKGTKVIISASDAGEKSWESDSYQASFFTHHFIQELKKSGDVRTAFEVANPRVVRNVKNEKKADQHPQAIASQSDWGR